RSLFSFILISPPPSPALFPYTTLFRSLLSRLRGRRIRLYGARAPRALAGIARCARRRGCRRGPALFAGRHAGSPGAARCTRPARSEEHTSELQSRENLVCRLLLEKKKT